MSMDGVIRRRPRMAGSGFVHGSSYTAEATDGRERMTVVIVVINNYKTME